MERYKERDVARASLAASGNLGLLYFILLSLRGPIQSAKDFDQKWPIFDSTQQREFRKVVQGIIQVLESQGALPRKVHRRTFTADVTSNPLPASLIDVTFSHAAALLPVTKVRIALPLGQNSNLVSNSFLYLLQWLWLPFLCLPGRSESFWKEADYMKQLWKYRQELKVEDAGIAALFGLELYCWLCAGEIAGRGFTFTGYYV
ncbi:hypothetical protein GIB67_011045 [Kingdonia uniflora]|uniref:HAUS augmin-like complex subunit 6 N-terminal domain-containing protein n=1 Tax=Kingdonia uniflora TaxID=39325 RepID=A0A7J7L6D8_9MAGN|nr:hypothetical protein GIB67_011045 [Kingdonia uniflora]